MVPRLLLPIVSALLLLPTIGHGQAPAPGPEHQALGFWIGSWEVEAEGHPNPLFPEGEYHATMTAEWFQGGFHVLCNYDWTGALGPYSELNVLGFDPGSEAHYSYGIDGFGGGSIFRGPRQGNTFVYSTEMDVEGQSVVFRRTVTNASPGLITWTSELSVDGDPWILAGEARATRQ